jgi:cryptochrome
MFPKIYVDDVLVQIPWNDNDELLAAWRDARTGYPWIDAIMVQVRSVVSFFGIQILIPI